MTENKRYTDEELKLRKKERNRIWYLKNVERCRSVCKAWSLKNKDYRREYKRSYRQENLESIRESELKYNNARREEQRAYAKKWREDNPDLARVEWAKRRAIKISATLPGHEEEIAIIYRRAMIMSNLTGTKYSVDHVWPLRGKRATGLHVPWNLQVIPLTENNKKQNSEPVFA